MRALVTGSAGFVGQHLITYLLQETDLEILGSVYYKLPLPPSDSPRVHFQHVDLQDEAAVHELIARWRPDYTFHLAGQSFVPYSWENPWLTFDQNVHIQLNLFRAMIEAEMEGRILVVGSGDEYGAIEPEDLPIDEKTPLRPVSPYAVSKIAQELLGWQYHHSHGIHAVRVRPFNHIGPGQREMFVASSFAKQIAEIEAGIKPPVLRHGNLDARRDFTDVRDMVRAYWLLITHGQPGEVYNAGSGRAVSIQHLLDTLLSLSTVSISTEIDPERMRPSDIPVIVCDPTRLHLTTGWQAAIPLEQTLADILDDWRAKVKK
jgi:GDP-4-dehydro-6-deoxy-D-mannose reductase